MAHWVIKQYTMYLFIGYPNGLEVGTIKVVALRPKCHKILMVGLRG